MIRRLQGSVIQLTALGVIVDVHGVGYEVAVPLRSLPRIAETVIYFTHYHVREDHQALYGFATIAELEAFERLLTVPSIGPKTALAILSVATPDALSQAVERDDVSFFQAIPGIGRKSAAKIIVELKGTILASGTVTAQSELVAALEGLGYRLADLQPFIQELPADRTDLQSQLTWVLQRIGRQ